MMIINGRPTLNLSLPRHPRPLVSSDETSTVVLKKSGRPPTVHFVRPTLEYASTVLSTDINRIEQVQRRGALFVYRNYWEKHPDVLQE